MAKRVPSPFLGGATSLPARPTQPPRGRPLQAASDPEAARDLIAALRENFPDAVAADMDARLSGSLVWRRTGQT